MGNITAGLISMGIASMIKSESLTTDTAWKMAFLMVPFPRSSAFLFSSGLKSPKSGLKPILTARLQESPWARIAVFSANPLATARSPWNDGVAFREGFGLWGIGFFAPELVGDVISNSFEGKRYCRDRDWRGRALERSEQHRAESWGLLGMIAFAWMAQKAGRKPACDRVPRCDGRHVGIL